MSADLAYGLKLTAVGLGIVFMVLCTLALCLLSIRRLDEKWQHRESEADKARSGADPSIDTTTAVLIAAAVATYLHGRHRIRSVRRLLPAGGRGGAWSSQGRAVLQGSHTIVKKTR